MFAKFPQAEKIKKSPWKGSRHVGGLEMASWSTATVEAWKPSHSEYVLKIELVKNVSYELC